MTKAQIIAEINNTVYENTGKKIKASDLNKALIDIVNTIPDGDPSVPQMFYDNEDRTHTGNTAETILGTPILIPANTMMENGHMLIEAMFFKSGTAGGMTYKWYLNVVPDLTGTPKEIGMISIADAPTLVTAMQRKLINKNSQSISNVIPINVSTLTEYNNYTVARRSINSDFSLDQYLICTVTLINGTDTAGYDYLNALVWNPLT